MTADAPDHACLKNGSVMELWVALMGVMSHRRLVLFQWTANGVNGQDGNLAT